MRVTAPRATRRRDQQREWRPRKKEGKCARFCHCSLSTQRFIIARARALKLFFTRSKAEFVRGFADDQIFQSRG
jgi:hypothetical protein